MNIKECEPYGEKTFKDKGGEKNQELNSQETITFTTLLYIQFQPSSIACKGDEMGKACKA